MTIENKQCEGNCPRCGSTDIDYEAIKLGDGAMYYPGRCNDCNCSFKEYLKYSDTEWED